MATAEYIITILAIIFSIKNIQLRVVNKEGAFEVGCAVLFLLYCIGALFLIYFLELKI